MFSLRGSGATGTRMLAIGITAASILAAPAIQAETLMTINGKAMESEMLDAYMRQRIQKPLDQLTDEERQILTDELTDLFVLSTIDLAKTAEAEPAIANQLELQRMAILSQVVATRIAETIDVSEEEIEEVYAEQAALAPKFQLKASHILVESQAEAIEIIELLIAGGSFTELAKERSKDASAESGGDLGWFFPNQMVRPFSEAVIRLGDGRYTTDPIQTQFGWHVIRRDGSRPAEPPPLEGVREQIVTAIQQQKLRAEIDKVKAESMN